MVERPMKLVTITFSHYADKARWALEHFGIPYTEVGYLPGFHVPGVLWATRFRPGKADAASSPLSTPVLITDAGSVIYDSSAIARWASDTYGNPSTTLYPVDYLEAVLSMERELCDRLGPHTRRWGYRALMRDPEAFRQFIHDNAPRVQGGLARVAVPAIGSLIKRALKVSDRSVQRSIETVREVFDAYAPVVEGRRYLVGNRLTAADISLATMAAPVLLVSREDGYAANFPALDRVRNAEDRSVVEEMRGSPVGRFVRRLYCEDRVGRTDWVPWPIPRVLH